MPSHNSSSSSSPRSSSGPDQQADSDLSSEEMDWLADLRRHQGWEVFRRLVHRRLYLPAYSNLRKVSGSNLVQDLGRLQGGLDMHDSIFSLAQELTKKGGLPR